MSSLFWAFAAAMLAIAVAFIVVPLRTGKQLLDYPAWLVVALLPLGVVLLYAFLGTPQMTTHVQVPTVASQGLARASSEDQPLASVASMVGGLEQRLEQEPDDADGWILLARSYHHIGQHADALRAYERAQALGRTDSKLESQLHGIADKVPTTNATRGPAIRGRVALSPDATSLVMPTDTLFVFAKASVDDRMPVLALRKSAADLPLDFVLTDKQAMVAGTQLSDYEQLVVTAKISRSGNAADNSLGLEASSDSISPSSNDRVDLLVVSIDGASNE